MTLKAGEQIMYLPATAGLVPGVFVLRGGSWVRVRDAIDTDYGPVASEDP